MIMISGCINYSNACVSMCRKNICNAERNERQSGKKNIHKLSRTENANDACDIHPQDFLCHFHPVIDIAIFYHVLHAVKVIKMLEIFLEPTDFSNGFIFTFYWTFSSENGE